jgi:pimeloyl-ACP methyl ester carboxylesterase
MTRFGTHLGLASSLVLSACGHLESHVVQFEGRDVEVVDAGVGPTTVVFEAGLGDDWHHWNAVASDVSEDTRVFAYSRPGYGESDETDTPRDPAHIVEDLRDLLVSQDIAPPYVLVGHSNGGTYMELFARSYPEETAGLVLVDSRPSNFLAECEAAGLDLCGVPADTVASTGGVFEEEYTTFGETAPDLMAAAATFGAYPVRVMTADRHRGVSDAWVDLWTDLHAAIAEEAEDGEQILVHGGHYLQVYHRGDVVDVVRGVLP